MEPSMSKSGWIHHNAEYENIPSCDTKSMVFMDEGHRDW